jgi:putative hydrolase of the HAD superfamily
VQNLLTAKRLGMLTVWVNATSRLPAYVDVKIRDVMKLPRILLQLI